MIADTRHHCRPTVNVLQVYATLCTANDAGKLGMTEPTNMAVFKAGRQAAHPSLTEHYKESKYIGIRLYFCSLPHLQHGCFFRDTSMASMCSPNGTLDMLPVRLL